MGEPIRLYKPDGEVITVYTRSQAATMLAGGEWFNTPAEAEATKAGAGVEEEEVTADPAPTPTKTARRKGKP